MTKGGEPQVNVGYAYGQFARALETARSHPDHATRARAQTRMQRWGQVIRGMADGTLDIGSRTAVADLPAWVTLEVVRGGFATGAAAADGPLAPHELDVIRRAGIASSRQPLFEYLISPAGLDALWSRLERREFAIDVPEDAALLCLVWLVRAGDAEAAAGLADALTPLAGRLRLLPSPATRPPLDPGVVFREPVGAVARRLEERSERPQIAAMRETLAVWNPLADEFLELWLDTTDGGRVGSIEPEGWQRRATSLLERYAALAAEHHHSGRPRRRRSNLNILIRATQGATGTHAPDPVPNRLLQSVVGAMVAKRGAPDSTEHATLRAEQARVLGLPTHAALAKVVLARLADLEPTRGASHVEPLVAPVDEREAAASGVPAGTPLPASIVRAVGRTLEGSPEQLIAAGVVPSAEVLAALVPRIAASAVAAAYPDAALQAIVAAHYEAFRRRRSLLLLNLEHQVRLHELPWIAALSSHRGAGAPDDSRASLARLVELTLTSFPGTLVPSPMVTELDALAREAGLDLPLVEELAADIFMGTFSSKFARAAGHAADLLHGTLYARYYAIDYDAVRRASWSSQRTKEAGEAFADVCRRRAGGGARPGFSVAANGTVIEQSQILTTHNLAVLTGPAGVGDEIDLDMAELAAGSLRTAMTLAGRLASNPRPLRTVKDIAYAWRQMVFYLSRLPGADQRAFAADAETLLAERSPDARKRLAPALAGLAAVVDGGHFDAEGRLGDGRRLLGWTVTPHWMLDV
jgi:hypothetical protein